MNESSIVLNTPIAVLSYQTKHRKTYDTLCLLKANGYSHVHVYATPLTYQKRRFPLVQHRPSFVYDIPETRDLCGNFGFAYSECAVNELDIAKNELVLVAGAGILPDDFVASHTIINAHPGYIPNCRGLDALKWAIVEDQPIGVTTHLLGKYVDAGCVIERVRIPVYENDTFHSVACRVYENEIYMLVRAVELVRHTEALQYIEPGEFQVHRRMPETVEKILFERFEEYKTKHVEELSSIASRNPDRTLI